MEILEFWKKYYGQSSNSSFTKIKRDKENYYVTYDIPLSKHDGFGIAWKTKEEKSVISRKAVEQYDYVDDPRFNTYLDLNQVLKEVLLVKIVCLYEKVDKQFLVTIFQQEYGYAGGVENLIPFVDSVIIEPEILIERVQRYVNNQSLFTDENIESESAFILSLLSHVKNDQLVPLVLDILNKGRVQIVEESIEFEFLNICEVILKNTYDLGSIKEIFKYIKNGSRTEKVRFGRILNIILSSAESLTLDELGGEYDSEEALLLWERKINYLEKSTAIEQWSYNTVSVYWERRLLSIQKMPKTLNAIKILLPMLNDEVLPVKIHAKVTLHKCFDFSAFYKVNNQQLSEEELTEKLHQYITDNFDRFQMDPESGKFILQPREL